MLSDNHKPAFLNASNLGVILSIIPLRFASSKIPPLPYVIIPNDLADFLAALSSTIAA